MKVRIKFSKQGPVKFVGHLDVMRYFQKAMRRADVDIKYSEGFSPHQIMSFAAPLGVGLTSNGEYMDIEVGETESSQVMVERLNAQMAEGIRVLSVRKLPDTMKTAMSLVTAADYTLTFRKAAKPENLDTFFEELNAFYEKESLLISKKTKTSEAVVDIKPLIYQLYRKEDSVFLQLSTGSSNNLKPELVMEAFYQTKGIVFDKAWMQIQREEVYGNTETDGVQSLIPLEDMGEEIE